MTAVLLTHKTVRHASLVWLSLLGLLLAGCSTDPFEQGKQAYDRDDYVAAERAWRPLAEQGDAAAQSFLGVMYDEGKGLPQDRGEALKWFRRSAEQGYAKAQYNLAVAYAEGKDVAEDFAEAYFWFYLAEAYGINEASDGVEYCARQLSPEQVQQAESRALEWVPSTTTP